MIYLEEFVQSFSQNPQLLAIASTVRVRVLHVRMDAYAKGLELTLDLLGSVPAGHLLLELEHKIFYNLNLKIHLKNLLRLVGQTYIN